MRLIELLLWTSAAYSASRRFLWVLVLQRGSPHRDFTTLFQPLDVCLQWTVWLYCSMLNEQHQLRDSSVCDIPYEETSVHMLGVNVKENVRQNTKSAANKQNRERERGR